MGNKGMQLAREFARVQNYLTRTAGNALDLQIYKEVARERVINFTALDLNRMNPLAANISDSK